MILGGFLLSTLYSLLGLDPFEPRCKSEINIASIF